MDNTDERNLRTIALNAAVATPGNPNKVVMAEQYLTFLKGGDAEEAKEPTAPVETKKTDEATDAPRGKRR